MLVSALVILSLILNACGGPGRLSASVSPVSVTGKECGQVCVVPVQWSVEDSSAAEVVCRVTLYNHQHEVATLSPYGTVAVDKRVWYTGYADVPVAYDGDTLTGHAACRNTGG